MVDVPIALFSGLVHLVSIPFEKLVAPANKKYGKPLGVVSLFFTCFCCVAVYPLGSPDTPPAAQAEPPAELSMDHAMQTAWAGITLAAELDATPTLQPTGTLALTDTPLPTATLPVLSTVIQPQTSSSIPTCIRPQEPQHAKVVSVTDGDTIRVSLDGNVVPLRYIGIDTPETNEPFGRESTQKNIELVSGKDVILYRDVSETDAFGRILRFVFVGDTFINHEMVRQGYATSFRYLPDTSCADAFDLADNQARANGMGMWMAQATFEAGAPSETLVIIFVNKEAEYADIQNRSNAPINLAGWRLVSEKGSQSCTLSGMIQPGETLRVWAGPDAGPGFNCGFGSNIWNNSESDPGVLYNPQNIEISRFP
ncbi:MAG: thermonuclease family protein [Anaerolineales bacterium]|nr:MAG: thermonuclease family protein [Anaerolineales bacterium]